MQVRYLSSARVDIRCHKRRPMLPRLDLADFFLGFSPRLGVLLGPVNVAFCIGNLMEIFSEGH